MTVEAIVSRLNDYADPWDCEFPYIIENTGEMIRRTIPDFYDAYDVLKAAGYGHYGPSDKYAILEDGLATIKTFSDLDGLFEIIPPGIIAEIFTLQEEAE